MINSSRNCGVSGKPDAVFSCQGESSQNTSERDRSNESNRPLHSTFRLTNPTNIGKSLLDGNKDHFEKQEHQVGSLNTCIGELQQQAYAQRLELEDAHQGYIESRRKQAGLQKRIIYEGKKASRNSDTKYPRESSRITS